MAVVAAVAVRDFITIMALEPSYHTVALVAVVAVVAVIAVVPQ